MITPEEYEKKVKSPITDEDDDMRLPIPVVVTIVVLSSLIGLFIGKGLTMFPGGQFWENAYI